MARLAPAAGSDAGSVQRRFEALARRVAGEAAPDRLGSLHRDELRRFIASLFDLALDARLLSGGDVVDGRWSASQRRLHAHFAPNRDLAAVVTPEELDEILFELARVLDLIEEERAYFMAREGPVVAVRIGGAERRIELPETVVALRRERGRLVSGEVWLAAGDRLRLFLGRDGDLLALAREAVPAGRPAEGKSWVRFRSLARLRQSVAAVYSGFVLDRIEIEERGVSNRVGAVRLWAASGDSVRVEGLAVRWTLDLPDTLFDMRRTTENGAVGWSFSGRGHGHGVGMCQIGAVAMGRRGQSYREILAHYYTGARLGRLKTG
ncbi:MAG: hypothetical protein R3190_17640 [Thermoanaerobaculia bacterium]|nr:hypothetical protein [Thermoanaerobaculia bacterium]